MSQRRRASLSAFCVIVTPLVASCGGSSGGAVSDASTKDTFVADVAPPTDATDAHKEHHDAGHKGVPLTVIVPAKEGSVTSTDRQIYCGFGGSCVGYYPVGTAVTLNEARGIEYLFKGWGGACASSGMNPSCTIALEVPTTVSVEYEIPPLVPLTVSVTGGTGDTVTSTPSGISTTGTQTASFPEGTGMTLTAEPGVSQTFSKWVGGQCGSPMTSTTSPCKFGLGGPDTETATFMAGYVYNTPDVFAWDGRGFSYETSVGSATIDRFSEVRGGKDLAFLPMWARLDHAAVDSASGAGVVRTKFVAADDEIVYLDRASLAAVTHPLGYEVVTSTSVDWASIGQRDPGALFALRTASLHAPLHATWMGKEDVTATLALSDGVAARSRKRVGNYYDLDFGPAGALPARWLVVDGWKGKEVRDLPAEVAQEPPHLDIKQADGTWVKALDLAMPRGDKKTLAFDVSALAFPTGRWEMRLVPGTYEDGTSAWFLDRVRLTDDVALRLTPAELSPKAATLSFTGPPTIVPNDDWHPRRVTDDGKGELGDGSLTYGRFTRYGDVRDLLLSSDDRMVVMRRGDAVELLFSGVPKAGPGEEVTVLFGTEVLYKPHRFFTESRADLEQVEPLPYHGMGHYPPAAPFPADKAHAAWRAKYETRVYRQGDTHWGP